MAIDNSYVLQQVLQEQSKSNDNLSAMREILADTLKLQQKNKNNNSNNNNSNNSSSSSNNNSSNRRRGTTSKKFDSSSLFKTLFSEMKNFSKTVTGNSATAANVVGSLSSSVGSVAGSLKMIPGPVGAAVTAFAAIVDAGMAVYDYLNAQLKMYNQLNSAGLTLRDGMLTARAAAANSYMSLNEFSDALEKNSSSVAAMDGQYGDGVQHFADLMGSVQQLQQVNGLYGVSQQQLADLTAKNFKYEKLYASQNALRSINQTQSTADFVNQMTYLSKTVGKSVDELLGKFDSMGDTLDSTVSQYAMSDNWGFDPDKAAEVTKTMNSVYSSMGETGATLQKINASRLSLFQLPDEYNNNFMQGYADMMENLQRSGVTDAKVVRQTMSQYVKEHSAQLREELIAQQRSGNVQAAALLTQIQNQEKLLNNSNTKTNAQLEQYTNNFNMWITDTFTKPFNEMYTKIQFSTMKYLSEVADRSDGAVDFIKNVAGDAYKALYDSTKNVFNIIVDTISNFGISIMESLMGDSYNKVKESFNKLFDTLSSIPSKIGSYIMSWLTGSDVENSKKELDASVSNVFVEFTSFWDNIKNTKFNYDDMKSKIQNSFEDMKKSMMGWWDTAKGWFSGNDPVPKSPQNNASNNSTVIPPINTNTNQQQQTVVAQNKPVQPPVLAEPPLLKPEKISEDAKKKEDAANNQPQTPLINYDEDMLAALKTIAGALDSANSTNQQNAQLLRQISENTEATRQT